MEIVRYICEFFFGNFWHFLGLFVLVLAACDASIFTINIGKKNDNEEEKK